MPKKGNWDGKSRGGRTGYLVFTYILRHFGVGFAYAFLVLVVPYFVIFAPSQTRASYHYQRRRLHKGRIRSALGVFRHFYTFGQVLIDKVAMYAGLADRYNIIYDNHEKALEIVQRNSGAVFIGAHIGNWEIAAPFFRNHMKNISVVMYQNENQDIKQFLESIYGTLPFTPIAVNRDPIGAMIEIKAALNDGGYVCFDGDRYVDRNSAVQKKLLGAECLLPEGPFRIASRCRVPVMFFYALREKHRSYRFIYEEIPAEKCWRDPDALMDAYAASLEDKLKKYPMQWFNLYEFWENKE